MAVVILRAQRGGRGNVPGRWASHTYRVSIRIPGLNADSTTEQMLWQKAYPHGPYTKANPSGRPGPPPTSA